MTKILTKIAYLGETCDQFPEKFHRRPARGIVLRQSKNLANGGVERQWNVGLASMRDLRCDLAFVAVELQQR